MHAGSCSRILTSCRCWDTYRHILGLEFFDGFDLASDVPNLACRRKLRLLRRTQLYWLVPDYIVSIVLAYFFRSPIDSNYFSLVPETSRYTLEELDEVFSQSTQKIMKTGRDQLKWLITGVGRKKPYRGRWVRDEYPRLVSPAAFRDEQELEDRGGVATNNLTRRPVRSYS